MQAKSNGPVGGYNCIHKITSCKNSHLRNNFARVDLPVHNDLAKNHMPFFAILNRALGLRQLQFELSAESIIDLQKSGHDGLA
jgi:hypothetical protein